MVCYTETMKRIGKTNKCKTCEKSFHPQNGRPDQPYCSRGCYSDAIRGQHRKEGVTYRMRTAKGHPIAPPSGVVAVARLNLWDRIGEGPHKCHWCGVDVSWFMSRYEEGSLIVDHLNWDATDDTQNNLIPSCNTCNAHRREKGGLGKIKSEELTVLRNGKPTRAVKTICHFCHSDFLVPPAVLAKGKGKYCSRDCMYQRNKP